MATKQAKQDIKTLLRQPEVWIGLVTALVVLFFALKTAPVQTIKNYISGLIPKQKMVSPVPETAPTATPAPTAVVKKPLPAIKTLADTSGSNRVTVLNGDSFWTISKRVCGTGVYFEALQERNDYMSLHAGDEVEVECHY
ncbi:LysM peptidoglycan-binding domain-containing protein [Candidatus Roizmanbacteria bacterium]|nr:LysM peptidoglycan-binding domain-containing protein [Candidatus Roizmanbacteria bacterium]